MQFSPMQKEYLDKAVHRWNFKTGAVRSGKTFVDIAAVIPKRILKRKGKDGLKVFLGVTEMTLTRNIIEPLQQMFGSELVSNISSNKAKIFGETVYCLGAEKISQVSKIQGASFAYVYGDEVAKWNKEVFTMLKSRLDKEYSCFDGTLNPENPSHWIKSFLDDKEIDIYVQKYTLFDNPNLPKAFVDSLCKEYTGVNYLRYVLGEWVRAEGLCYPEFVHNTNDFMIDIEEITPEMRVNIGVDFGKSASKMGFVATSIHHNKLYVLYAKDVSVANLTFNQMKREFAKLLDEFINLYPNNKISYSFCDSAEPTYITSFRNEYSTIGIRGSVKREILHRIRATNILMGGRRLSIGKAHCKSLIDGFYEAVWNEKNLQEDERLDDGTTNIDILDSFEYSFEYYIPQLVRL